MQVSLSTTGKGVNCSFFFSILETVLIAGIRSDGSIGIRVAMEDVSGSWNKSINSLNAH